MAARLPLVALAGAALLAAAPAVAQATMPKFCVGEGVENADGKYYRAREGGAYCDGIVFEQHSRSGLLPVLAVATGVDGEAPVEKAVRVLAPEPAAGPIRVRGLALDSRHNYRLDAELTEGTRLLLGPDSGLALDGSLSLAAVGWLAWNDSPQGVRYLPTLDPVLDPATITITVRPTQHANFVLFSVADTAGKELVELTEAARDVDANTNVVFTVPAWGPSPIVVGVLAIGKAGGRETADLVIVRRGQDDGE